MKDFIDVAKVVMSFEAVVFITTYVITAAVCIARNTHKPNAGLEPRGNRVGSEPLLDSES